MPIYEFVCGTCGERFESLVDLGTESAPCRGCGAEGATRVLSAQAASMQLVKSRGEARKQERANAALHRRTKADFKQRRAAAREARKPGKGNG